MQPQPQQQQQQQASSAFNAGLYSGLVVGSGLTASSAHQAPSAASLPGQAGRRGSDGSGEKKREKRPRSEPDAASAFAASAEETKESGEADGGDESTDDEEEAAAAAAHFLDVLNTSRSSDGEAAAGGLLAGGGLASGLGQYELELLQREVDELHDEAMAERNRADDMEDRYQRIVSKLRGLQVKVHLLADARRKTADAVDSAVSLGSSSSSEWSRSGDELLSEVRDTVDDLLAQSGSREEETAGPKGASAISSASSVAHARLNRFLSKSQGESAATETRERPAEADAALTPLLLPLAVSFRRFCKPCRLVTTLSKKPFKTLLVDVQRQYTMSKRETRRMSKEEKEKLVGVPLRIMGTPHRNNIYFVASQHYIAAAAAAAACSRCISTLAAAHAVYVLCPP
jgi:hypothetical protein